MTAVSTRTTQQAATRMWPPLLMNTVECRQHDDAGLVVCRRVRDDRAAHTTGSIHDEMRHVRRHVHVLAGASDEEFLEPLAEVHRGLAFDHVDGGLDAAMQMRLRARARG